MSCNGLFIAAYKTHIGVATRAKQFYFRDNRKRNVLPAAVGNFAFPVAAAAAGNLLVHRIGAGCLVALP